jgi:hypothetical protein
VRDTGAKVALKHRTNAIASHNKVSRVARWSPAVIAVSETLRGSPAWEREAAAEAQL